MSQDSQLERLQKLREEQAYRWRRGEKLLVEEICKREPDLSTNSEALLELLYNEVLLRESAGEKPTAEEFTLRFPKLAEELRRQFAVHAALPPQEATNWARVADQTIEHSSTQTAMLVGAPAPMPLPMIPGYQIEKELGRGGMGVVYRAKHRQLNRTVALKMLRDRGLADGAQLARFRVEAEAVAKLQHPNIVQIYDFGEHDGLPYISLEYISGGSLEAWTRGPVQPVRECCALIELVARAIAHAHRRHIIHRDLKPANILFDPYDDQQETRPSGSSGSHSQHREILPFRPKITDFGLAKRFAEDSSLTHSEAILGTGAYMSPEQAWGHSKDVGPATDIHALGSILYELLTGESPFRDASLVKTLDRVRFEEARPPSQLRAEIPPSLDAVVLRCLRKKPEERYTTADELADDLRRFIAGEPVTTPPSPPANASSPALLPAAIAIGGLVAAVILAILFFGPTTDTVDPQNVNRGIGENQGGEVLLPPRTQGEPFALLVGVRSYKIGSSPIDLKYTESDVEELSRLLNRQGYPRKNIRLLTQWGEVDNPALAPTGANIRAALERLKKECIPDDTLLLALTGVGGSQDGEWIYCYLPADADLAEQKSLITMSELYKLLAEIPAKKKLVLVDTCQSASVGGVNWPKAPNPPEGVAVLFACGPRETSYENATIKHGVFSYQVLQALEGKADADQNGVITLDELKQYTGAGVRDFLAEQVPGAVQTPTLISSLKGTTAVLPAGPKSP